MSMELLSPEVFITVAYRDGTIKEPTKSELVRFLVTHILSSIRQEQEKLSLPS
jgi:hypothetical protein